MKRGEKRCAEPRAKGLLHEQVESHFLFGTHLQPAKLQRACQGCEGQQPWQSLPTHVAFNAEVRHVPLPVDIPLANRLTAHPGCKE